MLKIEKDVFGDKGTLVSRMEIVFTRADVTITKTDQETGEVMALIMTREEYGILLEIQGYSVPAYKTI